jgi:hypothetical protein
MEVFVVFSFSRGFFAAVGLGGDGVEHAVGVGDSGEWKLQLADANFGRGSDVTSMNSPEKAIAKVFQIGVAGHLLQQ